MYPSFTGLAYGKEWRVRRIDVRYRQRGGSRTTSPLGSYAANLPHDPVLKYHSGIALAPVPLLEISVLGGSI